MCFDLRSNNYWCIGPDEAHCDSVTDKTCTVFICCKHRHSVAQSTVRAGIMIKDWAPAEVVATGAPQYDVVVWG